MAFVIYVMCLSNFIQNVTRGFPPNHMVVGLMIYQNDSMRDLFSLSQISALQLVGINVINSNCNFLEKELIFDRIW